MNYLTRRRIYREACDDWRRGVMDGTNGTKPDPTSVEEGSHNADGRFRAAYDAGYEAGTERRLAAQRMGHEVREIGLAWEIPTLAWALVLAEAQRP